MSETCSVLSRQLGEPIGGTAAERTAVWIVLENRGAWPAKAVRDGDLPDAVKQRLMGWEAEIEGARVQLARRSGRCEGPPSFWLGVSDLGGAALWRWSLESVEDVLQLDVPALVRALRRGEAAVDGAVEPSGPLVLVCTNGRRDVCCATRGNPVAQALSGEPGLDVWHTTHLGGHRFAATMLVLPRGLCYGRVEPDEVPALAEAIRGGRIYRIDRLRGRTALSRCEQAAESVWRAQAGGDEADALASVEHESVDDHVNVTLRDRGSVVYHVRMQHRSLGVSAPPSCGKPPEPIGGWFALD